MTLKNDRAHLLYYIKLCASFQSHGWIQTQVTVRKRSIWVKIGNFLSRVTFKFDGWPWETIGHLFYTTSSSVHHFKAMGEFKLKLQSGPETPNLGQNRRFFRRVTLKIDGWHLKTIGHIFNATSSFVHHFVGIGEFSPESPNLGQNRRFFLAVWPCNLTDNLKNQ